MTSDVPKNEKYPNGTYIRDFVGCARFGDEKHIIGKQAQTWMCLFDCPRGEKPGAIADITAWAASNGWQPPKPPTRVPMFPDRRRERVDFVD